MTDSRAALEEAAEKFWREKHARAKGNVVPITAALADFAEKQLEAAWREARLCDDIALDQPLDKIISEVQADRERLWAESSSLKLLLRAMCKNYASMTVDPHGNILSIRKALVALAWRDFPVELDYSGIPVITPEIVEALEAAK